MFIALLTYIKPLEEVERYLFDHAAFLDRYYESGHLICSGRKVPRTGGVIVGRADSREEMENILREDPFSSHGVAFYEIIEFNPTKWSVSPEPFKEK